MTMTKKHYVQLAKRLAAIRPTSIITSENKEDIRYIEGKMKGWIESINAVADVCKEDNPNRFDRLRFIEACND